MIAHFLWVRNLGAVVAGNVFAEGLSWKSIQDIGWRLLSSENSNGAGEFASKVADPHGWQVGAGRWQETSVSLHLCFPSVLQRQCLASLSERTMNDQDRSQNVFFDFASEATSPFLQHPIGYKGQPYSIQECRTRGVVNTRRQDYGA